MTWIKADELFRKARNKSKGYRLPGRGGNTRLIKLGDDYGIQLYNTIVVRINKDGSYILNSGGHRTHTTTARINLYSPVRVYQRKFKWYVNGNDFQDGMIVDEDYGEGGG